MKEFDSPFVIIPGKINYTISQCLNRQLLLVHLTIPQLRLLQSQRETHYKTQYHSLKEHLKEDVYDISHISTFFLPPDL